MKCQSSFELKNTKFAFAKTCLADICGGSAFFIILMIIVRMIRMMIRIMNVMIIFIQDDDDDDDAFFLAEYQEVCSGLTTIAGFYRYF